MLRDARCAGSCPRPRCCGSGSARPRRPSRRRRPGWRAAGAGAAAVSSGTPGTVVFAEQRQRGAADREHDQADDRARDGRARARPAGRSTEQPYAAGAGESLADVPRRGADERSRTCCARCCCRAATTSPTRSPSTSAAASPRFVAMMNALGARCWSSAAPTSRRRSGSTRRRQLLDRRRPRAPGATSLLRDRAGRRDRRREPSARLADGQRRRQPQRPAGGLPVDRRRQDRPHADAGYVLVGAARLDGMHADQRRARRPERGRARRRHAGAAALRPGRFRRVPGRARRAASRDAAGAPGARRTVAAGRARARSRVVARAQRARCTRRSTSPRAARSARCAAGAVEGAIVVRENGRVVRPVPLVTAAAVPARPRAATAAAGVAGPDRRRAALGAGHRVLGCSLPLMRRRAMRAPREVQLMIITVTLNAAIDKTLEVPSFRLGRRHRTVEQTTMPGGKGVNIARMLKTLGQPVIATGFAGRRRPAPRSSRSSARSRSSTTSCGSARSRAPTPRCSTRRPACRPRSTSAARRSPPTSSSCSARSCCTSRAARRSSCSPAALPRGVEPDVYAQLIREIRKLGVTTIVDTDGEPLRLAVRAEPDVVSPNELEAEELVGHEFNDDDDRAERGARDVSLGARAAIMTVPDGCYAQVLDDGAPRALPGHGRRAGGGRGGRLGRRVPRRLHRRALPRPLAGRVPALRRRLRRRVDRALRAPG